MAMTALAAVPALLAIAFAPLATAVLAPAMAATHLGPNCDNAVLIEDNPLVIPARMAVPIWPHVMDRRALNAASMRWPNPCSMPLLNAARSIAMALVDPLTAAWNNLCATALFLIT